MNRELLTMDEVEDNIALKTFDTNKFVPVDFSRNDVGLHFDGGEYAIKVKDRYVPAQENAVQSMLQMMGLSPNTYKQLNEDPEGLVYVANRRFDSTLLRADAMVKSKRIVGFATPGVRPINNEKIIQTIKDTVEEPYFNRFHIDDAGNTILQVVSNPEGTLEVDTKDDRYSHGVNIVNNPTISRSTQIEGYLHRLVCLNGMIAQDTVYKAPKNFDDVPQDAWLSHNMNLAMSKADEMVPDLAKLKNHEIHADLENFLAAIYKDLKVPTKARYLISGRILEHGAENMYDIFNHITYVASNYNEIRDDPRMSSSLMRVGARFVTELRDDCRACSRPIFN